MRLAAMLPNGRGGLYRGRITVASGRIVEVGPLPGTDGDADKDFTPHVALPGFVDLQLNGAFGQDITTDPSKMWSIGERLLSHGVTAFLPTVITAPLQQRQAAYDAIRSRPAGYRGAMPLGLHIEGPALAPDYAGVHPRAELVSGSEALSVEFLREADVVALVTIAPEVETASNSIARLVEAGIVVSLGHTAATAVQASVALDAGASALTHVFNGMGPLHHREVGAAGAGLLHSHAYVSLIADDHHLSEEAVRIAWRLAGPGRICLVTDAMAGMGAPAGTYRIGSEIVECGEAARNGDGSLAGSLITMPEAVRHVQRITGATWDELAAVASTNPADLLGDTERGRLSPGRRADIALVDSQLRPVATMLEGRIAYRRTERISVPQSSSPNAGLESAAFSSAAIGVDIGGTAFKAAVYDGTGLGRVLRGSTGPDKPAATVLSDIREAIDELLCTSEGADVRGVGVGCAGIVDGPSGVVIEATNLGWRDVHVTAAVGRGLGLPVVLDHDVYLGARAEWETGHGVGAASMLYVSVGTGVASRLFTVTGTERGGSQLAGEMGFVPVGSDSRPLERVASGRAISDAYRRETGRALGVPQIVASLRKDPVAARVWSTATDALAHGLATAVCLSDPEVVVLGGGLSKAGQHVLEAVGPRLGALLTPLRPPPPVVLAAHGDLSGLVGAALHAGLWTNRSHRACVPGSRAAGRPQVRAR